MVVSGTADGLLGRRAEREAFDRLLGDVRCGRSSVLVVRGEAGIGKTSLLDYVIGSASGFRVVRAVGVESEMELPFAALQQMCAPMLDRLDRLPDPQREALRVAFGLSLGHPPDRLRVALAVLSLLSETAGERPLLVVVDDAQWLDRASAQSLAFVARRLLAEPVALVFATREASKFTGLPDLVIAGLRDEHARELVESVIHAPLDDGVKRRIIAEARGNPLVLLELTRALTAEPASGLGLPRAMPPLGRIEEIFRRRLPKLPTDTRQLLVVAAAEPVGDPMLVWRAAERLGIRVEAAEPAEAEGLLAIGARVTFRHPVVRSVVYEAASLQARRAAHRALAYVTDPQLDPDRRAWHRAQAAPGPDEEVASELERSAGRAQARGGVAAAAAFLERAAVLTLDPPRRAERTLAAVQAKFDAGSFEAALGLLATAETGPLTELQRAHVDVLRGLITFVANRGADAPALLLAAASRFEPLDAARARDTYLAALLAASFAGRLASGTLAEVARAAGAAPASPQPPRPSDLLLDGVVLLITEGHQAAAPALRRTLDAFRSQDLTAEEGLHWLWLAGTAAGVLWDDETFDEFSARFVKLAREAGALTHLIFGLTTRARLHVFAGQFAMAAALVEQVCAVIETTRMRTAPIGQVVLAAFRGREAEASRLISVAGEHFLAGGQGMGLALVDWATAVLYNGLARYEEALAAAQQASDDRNNIWYSAWALPELVEAASRTGDGECAAEALQRLTEIARASGTDWALGIQARSRALLSDGEPADLLYQKAIERLARTRLRVELARAHLLYGEWLRRERRRLDAREQLHRAHEMFVQFGAEAFAERARVELKATGERARRRAPETRDQLTPQEEQIAHLAAEGETNQEIAGQLFISSSTVDYHLRKAFRKLGVKSRTQLARRVFASSAPTTRAD